MRAGKGSGWCMVVWMGMHGDGWGNVGMYILHIMIGVELPTIHLLLACRRALGNVLWMHLICCLPLLARPAWSPIFMQPATIVRPCTTHSFCWESGFYLFQGCAWSVAVCVWGMGVGDMAFACLATGVLGMTAAHACKPLRPRH